MKNIILLISITLVIISNATAAPTVSVVPSSMKINVGDTFTVNVSVDPDSIEILGAQFDLNYNMSKINAIGIEKGTFLTQDGVNSMIALRTCRINIGQCNYGETRFGVTNGILRPGTVAMITFKAQDSGEVSLQLNNVVLSGPGALIIPNVSYYNAGANIKLVDNYGNNGGISYENGNSGRISRENANIEIEEVLFPTTMVVEAPKTSEFPINSPNKKVGGFEVILVVIIISMTYILSRR